MCVKSILNLCSIPVKYISLVEGSLDNLCVEL